MHNQDYIASGILELYAAGDLTQVEREEVEHRAATSPEIRRALDEACWAMEQYATLHAVKPRPELRHKVLSQFGSPVAEQVHAPDTLTEPTVRALYPPEKEDTAYKWMFAASIVLLLLSGWLSFHFYNQWQQAEQRLAGVLQSEQQLAQNYRNTTLRVEQQEKLLAILQNKDFKQLQLQGVEAHPNASMTVYWNPQQQQVYVNNVALPTPPAGKQYQLWALEDGKPIDAGLIALADGKAELQQMKNIGAAQAFAVTLEPAGGSKVPTLEQLTVMGEVKSGSLL